MIFADLQSGRNATIKPKMGSDNDPRRYFVSPPEISADEIHGKAVSPDTVVLLPPENRMGWGRYPLRVRTLYFFS